jgi:hypothetical protein
MYDMIKEQQQTSVTQIWYDDTKEQEDVGRQVVVIVVVVGYDS